MYGSEACKERGWRKTRRISKRGLEKDGEIDMNRQVYKRGSPESHK